MPPSHIAADAAATMEILIQDEIRDGGIGHVPGRLRGLCISQPWTRWAATSALPLTNSPALANGLIRVASNKSSQGLSLSSIMSASSIAAAVPVVMPQALKPVATITAPSPEDDQPTNGALSTDW